jgi:hypothetical protein
MNKILFLIGAVIGFAASSTFIANAVALPQGTAVFETSLASRITSSDTSMTLAANSLRGGGSLSGYNCFTIDEGLTTAEYVCGTITSTTVSGMTRGISVSTATSTVAALQFAHRVGANVKNTDFPLIQIMRNLLNGVESFPNLLTYISGTACSVSSSNFTLCDKAYIDSRVTAGGAAANETTQGIVELATQTEAASTTSTGGTTARLVIPASMATSSPGSNAGLQAVISQNNGKLAQAWFDLTQTFTWTGLHTFTGGLTSNGTTTISASNINTNPLKINTVAYKFPATLGASSTVLETDASGNLTWNRPTSAAISTSTTIALPTANGGSVSKTVFCPAPLVVAGGGYSAIPAPSVNTNTFATHIVASSYPDSSTSWNVYVWCGANNSSTCSSATITVYAICVNP